MYEFIRIQFRLGAISESEVRAFAPRWITAEEAEQIIGGA